MGVIKTALEIALEKTANVSSDKSSIVQFEAEQRGKKLANAFLDGDLNLPDELKKAAADAGCHAQNLRQGVFDVLITQIALPSSVEDLGKFDKLGRGFSALINAKEFENFFNQLIQIFTQYLQEAAQYEQMVRQQYAPKLRQKEEELSKRFGREIRINPMEDQEFVTVLSQHLNALKENYESVVEQARDEVKKMFGGE